MKLIYASLLTFVSLLISSAIFAQPRSWYFGFRGGLHLSKLSLGNDNIPRGKLLTSPTLGLTVSRDIRNHFSLQSGLSFSTKGGKISGQGPIGFEGDVSSDRKASLVSNQFYLQMPLYAMYHLKLSPDKAIHFTAGPYVALGIAGNTTINGSLIYGDMIVQEEKSEKTFGENGLQRFDFGIGAGVGFDLGEYVLGVNYELGLKDIGPGKQYFPPFYNSSYRNRTIALTLEYKF